MLQRQISKLPVDEMRILRRTAGVRLIDKVPNKKIKLKKLESEKNNTRKFRYGI